MPQQKEYKRTLPKNKPYGKIVMALNDKEKETLVQIKFLIGGAPIFSKYLKMFQSEGALVHCIFQYTKNLLLTILKHFIKADVVDSCKWAKDLVSLNISDESKQLPLE